MPNKRSFLLEQKGPEKQNILYLFLFETIRHLVLNKFEISSVPPKQVYVSLSFNEQK